MDETKYKRAITLFYEVTNRIQLDKSEFYILITRIENDTTIERKETDFFFDAFDVNYDGEISFEEFEDFLKYLCMNNEIYSRKIEFRSADTNRDNLISIDEALSIKQITNEKYDREKIEKLLNDLDLEDEFPFYVYYKLCTGVSIDEKTDPYDGKLQLLNSQSKCCLIL